jgi:ABC-type sugar transport system ATPase subunit
MSLLSVDHVTVRYGATTALDAVDLELAAGEIHAVVGENGAGKSTLLRVLAGARQPDAGTVTRAAGVRVAWVAQEPELPPDATATDWIFLAEELRGALGWLQTAPMHDAAVAALAAVGASIDPALRLGDLSASQRKQVQVARAVRQQAELWLLDEPTAVLGAAEAERLFAVARAVAQRGGAVVWVSHRLDEVLALADRVTVLRDGRRVAGGRASDFDAAALVRHMVGRELAGTARRRADPGAVALQVRALSAGRVRDVSFDVRAGEIVGLAGLIGSGRSTVLESLAGVHRARFDAAAPPAAVLLPEDRTRKGLIPTLSVRENIHLPAPALLDAAAERRATAAWIERLGLRTPGVDAPIGALSGGNQQKVLLARALRQAPRLLLLDEPTAGVDVGAKADIHDQIRALADDGTAVLLASSDLPELLAICDRILALYGGRLTAEFDATTVDEHRLGAAITGQPTAGGR